MFRGGDKHYRGEAYGITFEFSKCIPFVKFGCNFEGRILGKSAPIGALPRKRPSDRFGGPRPYRGEAFGITVEFSKGDSFVEFHLFNSTVILAQRETDV